MRKLLVAVLAVFFSTAALADVNVTDIQKATVNVETNDLGGHGSGTFIDPLHVLTVWHVKEGIKPGTILNVRTADGTVYKASIDKFNEDPTSDLGIMTIDADHPYAGPVAKIKCGVVPPLTRLINIGNPMMFEFVAVNLYSTGGKLSQLWQKKIDESPKASPPDAIKPDKLKPTASNKKSKKKIAKKAPEEDTNKVKDTERKRVFTNVMIVNGPIIQGQSGSALFDASDGSIIGVLHMTFTNDAGSLTSLGAAVEMSGPVCDWVKDQVGDGVFVK